MTADTSLAATVAEALKAGLEAAKREGSTSVHATHLEPQQLDCVAAGTLTHLRGRPGKESPIEGWTLITDRTAGVLRWWAEVAELSDADLRRFRSLRRDVYDVLVQRHLIEKEKGPNTSVHVSPTESGTTASTDFAGAWVLKLSPYVYDVNTVFAALDGRVRLWSVAQEVRSASMDEGQPVYLWIDEGDPHREAGIWGVGRVTGQCISGVADASWLDLDAASRATVFAVVEIMLLDQPVTRAAFLGDSRLTEAEVIRDPLAPNPGFLSPSEVQALAGHFTALLGTAEPQVA